MDRCVTSGGPTGAHAYQAGVIDITDEHLTPRDTGSLNLGVTTQAEVCVTLCQQFGVNRAVGAVTDRTALPQRRMLEHEWTRLFPVALAAGFV
jgi:hypothetical protein